MSHSPRFAVASGSDPRELARSLNDAASAGYGDIQTMALGPRGEVWVVVQAEAHVAPALAVDDELDAPASPPAAHPGVAEQPARTQIVSATTGRQVPDPGAAPAKGFATGDEQEAETYRDPLTPPPKSEGPSTKITSPAGRS